MASISFKKSPLPQKKLLMIGGGILLLVVVIILIVSSVRKGDDDTTTDDDDDTTTEATKKKKDDAAAKKKKDDAAAAAAAKKKKDDRAEEEARRAEEEARRAAGLEVKYEGPMVEKPADGWSVSSCRGTATTDDQKKNGWCKTNNNARDVGDSHYIDACCVPAQADLGYTWVTGAIPAGMAEFKPDPGQEVLGTIVAPATAATGSINDLKYNPRMKYDGCDTATNKCSNDHYSRFCKHLKNRGVCNNSAVKATYNNAWCRGVCD